MLQTSLQTQIAQHRGQKHRNQLAVSFTFKFSRFDNQNSSTRAQHFIRNKTRVNLKIKCVRSLSPCRSNIDFDDAMLRRKRLKLAK